MEHRVQVELIERLFALSETRAAEDGTRESELSTERYTSAAQLDRDREVLAKTPVAVARCEDLRARGDFVTTDLGGIPVLLCHDGEAVRAFVNVCRHRGTLLVNEARGTAKAFTCPYHAWSYELTGKLLHVPMANQFPSLPMAERGLSELPLEARHGFLWVTARPEPRGIELADWLGSVDADLTGFGLAEHRVMKRNVVEPACNWKLVIDAFLEGYHVKSLHRDSLSRFFSDAVVFDLITPHCRSVGARKNLSELRQSAREQWNLRAVSTVFYQLFPNTVLVFHPDWVSHILVTPLSVDRCRVEHTMLTPGDAPSEGKALEHWERTFALIDGQVFQNEDLMIAQRVQAGLAGTVGDTFALGRLEQPIWHFHQQLGTPGG